MLANLLIVFSSLEKYYYSTLEFLSEDEFLSRVEDLSNMFIVSIIYTVNYVKIVNSGTEHSEVHTYTVDFITYEQYIM